MRFLVVGLLLTAISVRAAEGTTILRVRPALDPTDTHILNDEGDALPPFPTLILECERSHPFRVPEFFAADGSVIRYTIVALPPVGTKARARVQLLIGSGSIEVRTPRAREPLTPAISVFEIDPMIGIAPSR